MAISPVAVGNKITASLINSIISAVNAVPSSRRNFLLNSDFGINQRSPGSTYTAVGFFQDRWRIHTALTGGALYTGTNVTIANTFGTKLALQFISSSATNSATFGQALPSDEVAKLRGQTIVFSAKLLSSAAATVTMKIQTSVTADADASATWTDLVSTGMSVTTTPTVYTTNSATVPTTANGIRVQFVLSNVPNTTTITFGQTQLEIGSVASTWNLQTGSIGNELSACQRYYWRTTSDSTATSAAFAVGVGGTTTAANTWVTFPVDMRVVPTLETTGTASNYRLSNPGSSDTALNAVPVLSGSGSTTRLGQITGNVAAGLTVGTGYVLRANALANVYIGFSAELA